MLVITFITITVLVSIQLWHCTQLPYVSSTTYVHCHQQTAWYRYSPIMYSLQLWPMSFPSHPSIDFCNSFILFSAMSRFARPPRNLFRLTDTRMSLQTSEPNTKHEITNHIFFTKNYNYFQFLAFFPELFQTPKHRHTKPFYASCPQCMRGIQKLLRPTQLIIQYIYIIFCHFSTWSLASEMHLVQCLSTGKILL